MNETHSNPTLPDPYLWLEEVMGERALVWVAERNIASSDELAESEEFKEISSRLLSIFDSDERIPGVVKMGEYYYNFWRDANNPRGLWRRTTLDEYRKPTPDWDVVIDLDALSEAEGENWVWDQGVEGFPPEYNRFLIPLSRGGGDAIVNREFDIEKREFVEDGFNLPEAKGEIRWRDADSVYAFTDFGPDSMTESGYPRIVKLWKRGTPISEATLIYEGNVEDVAVHAFRDHTKGFERDFILRRITFFTNELFYLRDGKQIKIETPDSANASPYREWLLIDLREDWDIGRRLYPSGSLLGIEFEAFLNGERNFDLLFEPTERTSLAGISETRNHILLNVLDNVSNRIYLLTYVDGSWQRELLPGMPLLGTIDVHVIDPESSDDYFVTIADFLTPSGLYLGTVGNGAPEKIKSVPSLFNADGLVTEQFEATSKDGTRIPYFQVGRKDIPLDGTTPTLLTGYGGFEVSNMPYYSGGTGAAWLEQGGVYVVANIRGGGEFGPKWHQAALKANRHKSFEDFSAVAQDLIDRKVTSPKYLGIRGGSNGGLLMGNMLTTYPELFGAIVIQVPLLDMLRYDKLLAGASWVSEFGSPDDPNEAEFLRRYSPYHNMSPDKVYPRVLFTTSTRDDRVHPGHARKMMALMTEQGHQPLYYENTEGGHSGSANNEQAAFMAALEYTFLWKELR